MIEKEIFNNIPAIVYRRLFDDDLTILHMSNPANDCTEIDLQYLKSKIFANIIFPVDISKVITTLDESVKTKKPYSIEYRITCAIGEECWVVDRGTPIFDNTGKLLYFDGIITNISKYKMFEEALCEGEERFRNILNNAEVAVVRTKLSDGSLIEVNNSFIHLLGYKSLDDIISNFTSSKHYAEPEGRLKYLASFKDDSLKNYELKLLKKDGSPLWVDCSSKMNVTEGYIDSILLDITEYKKTEEEVNKTKAQLIETAKFSTIGSLAGGIAHEMSTPINVILGYSEMIMDMLEKENIDKNEIKDCLLKQVASSKNLIKILDGIRAFGRTDTGNNNSVSFHTAINNTIRLVENIFKKDNIRIISNLQAANDKVIANMNLLQEVIYNLLANARDAVTKLKSGIERNVLIETNNVDTLLIVKISDNGIGMSKQVMDRIFEPFFSTKDPGHSTGLGLSVIQSSIKSIKGDLSVESFEDKGTTFTISIHVFCDQH